MTNRTMAVTAILASCLLIPFSLLTPPGCTSPGTSSTEDTGASGDSGDGTTDDDGGGEEPGDDGGEEPGDDGGSTTPEIVAYVFAGPDPDDPGALGGEPSEPWITDGTDAGTFLLKNIDGESETNIPPASITRLGDAWFFAAYDEVTGVELWKTDGTPEGTALFMDINTENSGIDPSYPECLVALDGMLYFQAIDGIETGHHGQEPWVSDGTSEGTQLLVDVIPDADQSSPCYFAELGSNLLFSGTLDLENGAELLVWNGESVTEIEVAPSSSSGPTGLVTLGSQVYFAADGGTDGTELWHSDGTEPGTAQDQNINPSGSSIPHDLTVSGGLLYFFAYDGGVGDKLYAHDGSIITELGGFGSSIGASGKQIIAGESGIYALVDDSDDGFEIWISDGTPENTVLWADLSDLTGATGEPSCNYGTQILGETADGQLIFLYDSDGDGADELWRSDGTPEGTVWIGGVDVPRSCVG